MPFICLARTDIPNSTLQITDLWPNKSQTNPVIDPPAVGPLYINAPTTAFVGITTAGAVQTFTVAASGLAAYLLANVQSAGAGGPALTPANALTMSNNIITAMRAGSTLSLAAINVILGAVVGGTVLTGGGSLSTGAVTDVLRILAGITYTVPAGTQIQAVGPIFVAQGSPAVFNAANFADHKDILPTDSSFYDSLSYGKIAGFKSATFSYLGTAGAAITVYDNAGGVF